MRNKVRIKMTEEEPKANKIVICVIFCLLFVLVPILWLIPSSFGYSIEFTVYYEDSVYFTNEKAVGIDVLLDGIYYGTTDAFGVLEIGISDQENHTISILYNEGLIYTYLIEYGTETVLVDVFLETKSLEATFLWNFDSQDLIIGEQFQLWIYKADVWQFVGTKTTDSLGMVLFGGLIMGEYKRHKIYFYLYKFVGVDYEIPLVLLELNQTTAFNSIELLVEPITTMFDFDYEDSAIFGVDYPVAGLEYTSWIYVRNYDTGEMEWHLWKSGVTDVDGRIYYYNQAPVDSPIRNNEVSHGFKVMWNYDGVDYEQEFTAFADIDFYYNLTCKEVQATFNWNTSGYPLASYTDVIFTFLDGTHAPIEFTTDANGQLTISGLIMGDYDLEGLVFASIQSVHTNIIPQILIEPTRDEGVLKNLVQNKFKPNFYFFLLFLKIFEKKITLIISFREGAPWIFVFW